MDKEMLKGLAGSKQFIEGIYNYCDRWCERCPLTSRCLNYALEGGEDSEDRDLSNQAFWDKFSASLQVAVELLEEFAAEHGIDLEALDSETAEAEEEKREEMARDHRCCRAALNYGEMVNDWFESARELQGGSDAEPGGEMELHPDGTGQEDDLRDALEVIRWYQHQIYVKLLRAVRGSLVDGLKVEEGFQKDSDGSAKVALIGIDRSVAAWGEVRDRFPFLDQETVRLAAHLERLRREVERAFPGARAFIRPGFDKIDLNS